MAGRTIHELNLTRKGRTGSLTKNRRKKRGIKSRLTGKSIVPQGSRPPQTSRSDREPIHLLDWGYGNHE
jgi:hypothetical protein